MADHVRQHHVLQRRQLGQEVIELEDEAERPVPELIPALLGAVVDPGRPSSQTDPWSGVSSRPEDVQQSVLLPDPLDDPTTATSSPRSTSKSTPRSTGTSLLALAIALRQAARRQVDRHLER